MSFIFVIQEKARKHRIRHVRFLTFLPLNSTDRCCPFSFYTLLTNKKKNETKNNHTQGDFRERKNKKRKSKKFSLESGKLEERAK